MNDPLIGNPIGLFERVRHLATPLLLIDLQQIEENIGRIRRALPGLKVFYAMKCNPDPRVLAVLAKLEVGFEVASLREVEMLLQIGVSPEKILCLHPIKSPGFINYLHRHHIDVLAADSRYELEKIAQYAPGSRVVIRVSVSNKGSIVPLNQKFGVAADEVLGLLKEAAQQGLLPFGITTHVGSQCESPDTWIKALAVCRQLQQQAADAGLPLTLISLGGGLPVAYSEKVPSAESMAKVIKDASRELKITENCIMSIEPGRAVVASAGTLITSVIGIADRVNGSWAYLDAGAYQGLFEATQAGGGIRYPITVEHAHRPNRLYHLAGPTCDSFDLAFENLSLPELRLGDRIAVHYAGAYSTAISSTFNGFKGPTVYYIEDLI